MRTIVGTTEFTRARGRYRAHETYQHVIKRAERRDRLNRRLDLLAFKVDLFATRVKLVKAAQVIAAQGLV